MIKYSVLLVVLFNQVTGLVPAQSGLVDELAAGVVETANTALHPAAHARKLTRDAVDFSKFPDKSKGPQRAYTWSEVAQCDGQADRPLFIVVTNQVYDVTTFADCVNVRPKLAINRCGGGENEHPAGPEPIKRHAGQDATVAVKASGMPHQILDVFFKIFLVGWIQDSEKESRIMGEVTRYTMADVKTRNGKSSNPVWIVYKDSVYDLTNYLDEHPAGGDMIVEEAGTDATKAFDESGHTPDAKVIMAKYKIGELVEDEQIAHLMEEKRFDANGKKKKKVLSAPPEKNNRSCFNIISCGLIG